MKDFDIKKVESLRIWQRRYRLTELFSKGVAIGSIISVCSFAAFGVFLKAVLAGSVLFILIAFLCSLVVHKIEVNIRKMVGEEPEQNG